MYSILMDSNTKCYYMKPRDISFTAFSNVFNCKAKNPESRLIETEYSDIKEFTTMLYNAGFIYGTIDNEPVNLTKNDAYFFNKNNNEILYAQYLLTKDERYLQSISKKNLVSLCKLQNGKAFFPSIELPTGDIAVLAYTDSLRVPQVLIDKYPDYSHVKMSFNVRAMVNGKFLIE